MSASKLIIGSEEWVSLPQLGLPVIKCRIDSGAKTSALHAYNIQPFEEKGESFVRFDVHPVQKNRRIVKRCTAPVIERRVVKSSNGEAEKRFVIKTTISLGDKSWPIEVTLTNRDSMGYRMLLGREAMHQRVLVDPAAKQCVRCLRDSDIHQFYDAPEPNSRALRIAVLASNTDLYSNRRIIEAGQARGHEMLFINVRQCYMNISREHGAIHYRGGESLAHVDAVIPRLRPAVTFYGCAVLRQFENMGSFCLNDAIAIARSRDKLRSLQILSSKGINMPITGFASSPEDTKDLIKLVGGAPLIVKLLEGTQGRGVVLAETDKAAESVINAFKSLKANILVQEFIREAQGKDIRCFVVDNKVVGAMQREAPEGEFRANVHLGGTVSAIRLTAEEKKMAVAAARAMGLHVAGVDIIRSNSGAKVLEVNSSPGLQGIENATGSDIASTMIEAVEKYAMVTLQQPTLI